MKPAPPPKGPRPLTMARIRELMAQAQGYSEPGTMLAVYVRGERPTPEETEAVRRAVLKGDDP